MNLKTQKQHLVLISVNELIKTLKNTHVKEIKNYLIDNCPDIYWTKDFIKDVLKEYKDKFNVKTIGELTLYSKLVKKKPSVNTVFTNKTELAKLVKNSNHKFLTIVHKKVTDNTLNKMNCQFLKMNDLGLFIVNEKKQIKTIYPNTLKEVRINKIIYKLK